MVDLRFYFKNHFAEQHAKRKPEAEVKGNFRLKIEIWPLAAIPNISLLFGTSFFSTLKNPHAKQIYPTAMNVLC